MAGLAAGSAAVGPDLLHPFLELALVDVLVATGTVQALPVINHIRFGLELGRFLVAIRARHCNMAAGQHKTSLLVLGQGKRRGLVSLEIMTLVAGVEIRSRRKLAGMAVLVAVGANVKLDPIERVPAFWNVALRAFQPGVTALQRILGRSMLLDGEQRGLPALDIVARGALATVRPLGELPVVGVLVAIGALLERERFLEIPVGVALFALDLGVLALQRILCLRMVELLTNALQGDLLPSGRAMARRAGLREAAMMRVFVAVRAQIKWDANVLRLVIGAIGVALGALYLRVETG